MTPSRRPSAHADPALDASWSAAAAAVLRRSGRLTADAPDSDAWETLARRTVEGFTVPPLGTAEKSADPASAEARGSWPGHAPFLRGSRPAEASRGGWDIRVLVADPDAAAANRAALVDLEGGASSLWIAVGDGATTAAEVARVLSGVDLAATPVVLDDRGDPDAGRRAADALAELAARHGQRLHPGGSLGADPLGAAARTALRPDPKPGPHPWECGRTVRKLGARCSLGRALGVGAIVVDGTVAHDAGAGDAGEVGYSLAAGATYLRVLAEADLDVDAACRLISFRYAATDDQFVTIAKLRAARLVWHRVAQLSGASSGASAQRQHAVTSRAMLTRYDAFVNMLRGTVGCFASAAGGAEAVTVLPFDETLGAPEAFSRRMARNVSALLHGEAQLSAVADPAGGAHALETLSATIAEAAWTEFGDIEAVGGLPAALANGSFASRVDRVRAERDRRIARRRQPITGISEFPNAAESAGDLPGRRTERKPPAVARWAEPFEVLRDAPMAAPVLLVTIGTPASASARLLFARNLLAAGGVRVIEPEADTSMAAAVTESLRRVLMLAGSDADYHETLVPVARAARDAGAEHLFAVGRPPEVLDHVSSGLIDGAVAAGDDVLDFLTAVRRTVRGSP